MQCSERLLNLENGGVQDYVYKMPAPSTYPLAHDLALWEKKGNPSTPSLRLIWFSHHRLHNLYGNLFYARNVRRTSLGVELNAASSSTSMANSGIASLANECLLYASTALHDMESYDACSGWQKRFPEIDLDLSSSEMFTLYNAHCHQVHADQGFAYF